MYIAIPFDGRVRTLIRSSFVLAKRLSETAYDLSGDSFRMTQVTAEQALVFRAVEILPALLVDVKPLPGDPRLLHGIELPLLILTLSRHPNISIFHAFRLLLFHRPNSDRCGRERPA